VSVDDPVRRAYGAARSLIPSTPGVAGHEQANRGLLERGRGDAVKPVVLAPNDVPRFYRGGRAIARLRGTEPAGERTPEDWVGSTTAVFGRPELGLSRLPDGKLLRDATAADPVAFFGPDHAARHGGDPALLVKLLDAGQRLPVHAHPDGRFARMHLDAPCGKTEAWIVVDTDRPDATVHAGFREDVAPATLERWVTEQDHAALLGALNVLSVAPGDAIFVPAGVPHAIGEGVLIVELQEPSDLSVLLEWDGFGIDDPAEATLGLGWEVALRCVQTAARDPRSLRAPRARDDAAVTRLLPRAADPFFRAERIAPSPVVTLERGFAILVVIDGAGVLHGGEALPVHRGDTVLVPWEAGPCHLEGDAVAIACRPPDPGMRRVPIGAQPAAP
jgi:mannose-6-phosphate isomerase